jgi:hypothetical protein
MGWTTLSQVRTPLLIIFTKRIESRSFDVTTTTAILQPQTYTVHKYLGVTDTTNIDCYQNEIQSLRRSLKEQP